MARSLSSVFVQTSGTVLVYSQTRGVPWPHSVAGGILAYALCEVHEGFPNLEVPRAPGDAAVVFAIPSQRNL